MKLINKLDYYLYNREYKIIIKENSVNIINYDEIIDFNVTSISVKYRNKIIIIDGKNLIISKMIKDEVLITGEIIAIRIN